MTITDIQDVAAIHCEALSGDFLPSLGKSFLISLYNCILVLNIGFGFVYKKNDHVAGVVVATENTQRFFKVLFLKRFWAMAPKMLWALLKHPNLIKNTLETLIFGKSETDKEYPVAELIVLVLHSNYQRQGIGTQLVQALNGEFAKRGIESYIVRTYADNKGSNKFFKNNDFKWNRSYMMYGRSWNIYKYNVQKYAQQ